MHEKNIALLCDEADRLLQLNINLLRQMVEEPDVLSDSKNENRRKRKLTAVCSHQTRIGNLDAHLI